MVAAKPIAMMFVSAAVAGLAGLVGLIGCATTHGHLARSADRLEHDSDALASDVRTPSSDFATSGYAREASDLADRSDELRRILNDRRSEQRDVQHAFARVSNSYRALRADVDRNGNEEARADLRVVTQDYRELEGQMQGYPADGRYAEGGLRGLD